MDCKEWTQTKYLQNQVHALHSSKKKLDDDLNLEVDGMAIEQVQVFKYLGVLINDTLTWSNHVGQWEGLP